MFVMLMGAGALLACRPAAREFNVQGPEGGIALKVTLPDGFDTTTGQCPMVILMHGIFSSKDYIPMPQLAKGLAKAGIASIRFDFDGHGKSEGRMQDMTIEKELADAQAIWKSGQRRKPHHHPPPQSGHRPHRGVFQKGLQPLIINPSRQKRGL